MLTSVSRPAVARAGLNIRALLFHARALAGLCLGPTRSQQHGQQALWSLGVCVLTASIADACRALPCVHEADTPVEKAPIHTSVSMTSLYLHACCVLRLCACRAAVAAAMANRSSQPQQPDQLQA